MASELEELTKLPGEDDLFDMDFANRMSSDETINSVVSATFTNTNRIDGSLDITLGSASYSGTVAQFRISGGQQDEGYIIIITVLTSLGNTKIGKGLLRVE